MPTRTAFEKHDHHVCQATALAAAEKLCTERKVQLTPTRRRVLEILLAGHKAHGAYEILGQLAAEGLGSQPPVVYRALDFLVSNGLAHRIEHLNSYIACAHPGQAHAPAFMICRSCNSVVETRGAMDDGALASAAQDAGFRIERAVVEAEGLCPACAKANPA